MARKPLIAGLLLLFTSGASAFEYALDDGTGNFNIGPSQFDAQMLWGNYFVAEPGFETIDAISVSFAGSVPLGESVTVILFEDPTDDLDPTDAVPVALASGVTISSAPNAFVDFDIPDTSVTGGFFAAAMMNLEQGQVAARMDPQSNLGRSWLFFDGTIDLDNLGGSPLFHNMAETPFNGSWMVRARAIPEPSGLLFGAASMMLLMRRRRRGRCQLVNPGPTSSTLRSRRSMPLQCCSPADLMYAN